MENERLRVLLLLISHSSEMVGAKEQFPHQFVRAQRYSGPWTSLAEHERKAFLAIGNNRHFSSGQRAKRASRYDVRIGGGSGVMGKRTEEGRLCEFISMNQFQMRTRGEGVKISKNFVDIIYGSP